jgi:phosphoribosylanthranilate isomerase
MARVRVKICCMASVEEARLAVAAGADALGLIGPMPSGPGPIDDGLIATIAPVVPPPVATFLLTSETGADAIIDHVRRCRTNTVQLVDRVAPEVYPQLRAALPALRIVQVVHVTGPEALAQARAIAPLADALLLDSGQPDALVRVLGGTGQTHDWRVSRAIVESVPCPVFLAGGLRADNVAEAIAAVRPFAIDVCTGVRSEGRLDPDRLAAFMAAARRAA